MTKSALVITTTLAALVAIGMFNTFSVNQSPSIFASQKSEKTIPSEIHTLYSKWASKYGKVVESPSEYQFRIKNFFNSFKVVQKLRNLHPEAKFALNEFSDWTKEEKKNNLLKLQQSAPTNTEDDDAEYSLNKAIVDSEALISDMVVQQDEEIPESLDNIPKELTSKEPFLESFNINDPVPVSGQVSCLSCWALTAKSIIEDALSNTVRVSAQYFMNCIKARETKGIEGPDYMHAACSAGEISQALDHALNVGYMTEEEVPYTELTDYMNDDNNCDIKPSRKLEGYKRYTRYIRPHDSLEMMLQTHKLGLGIVVRGENDFFYHFAGGVFDNNMENCHSPKTDHGVKLVGWEGDYWVVKNSFGVRWGENGYFRIKKNKNFKEPSNCICGGLVGTVACRVSGLTLNTSEDDSQPTGDSD